jgi:hypothetical protein
MGLPGDEPQVDARSGLFGDSASFDAGEEHCLRRTCHMHENSCSTHPMDLLGDSVSVSVSAR